MDSILTSVKKMLGIVAQDTSFDMDLILHINSVLSNLTLLGVGPKDGFCIDGEEGEWNELIQNDSKLNLVKSYMYLRVKALFDPSLTSAVIQSMASQAEKLEWQIQVITDGLETSEEGIQNGI